MLYYLVNYFFKGIFLASRRVSNFSFGAWLLEPTPSTPQFIRPTVPGPINIGDFATFIRPNVRPKPSQIRPIRPKLV